jgi:hypothetical protein
MARLVTSATVILLRDTAGLAPVARAASEMDVDALRSAPLPMIGFGPEMKELDQTLLD